MVVEILRLMDEGIIDKIRSATKNVPLTPKGETINEGELRSSFDSILDDAATRRL
jgi:hypothetical protein